MKKILIVDDDNEFASELNDILTDEGYLTCIANDGTKAINLINNDNFAVILLDYKIPTLNGIEVLKYIKSKKINVSIIIISGSLNIENLLEEAGVKIFVGSIIKKPYKVEELLMTIKTL